MPDNRKIIGKTLLVIMGSLANISLKIGQISIGI